MKQAKKKLVMPNPGANREEKRKALDTAIAQLEKDYGRGTIMKLGENARMEVQAVHTGSIALDFALGIGGLPRGRITEIFGPESSGKTTVALHVIAEVQKEGGEAALSTPSTRSTRFTPKPWGGYKQPARPQPDCATTRLKSPRRWCARVR